METVVSNATSTNSSLFAEKTKDGINLFVWPNVTRSELPKTGGAMVLSTDFLTNKLIDLTIEV